MELVESVGATADQPIRPQQPPSHWQGQITLAQMHAIGLHGQGQVDPVIDQEQGSMAMAEPPQLLGFEEPLAIVERIGRLGAVLHDPHPGRQGPRHNIPGSGAHDQIQGTTPQQGTTSVAIAMGAKQIHL